MFYRNKINEIKSEIATLAQRVSTMSSHQSEMNTEFISVIGTQANTVSNLIETVGILVDRIEALEEVLPNKQMYRGALDKITAKRKTEQ